MSNLSQNIKNLRMMRGLSQKQLGALLNKSPNAVSNWEKGTTSPDVDLLENICKILEVTPNQIYGWDKCPDLEVFLSSQQELLIEMDDLMKKRSELDAQIREYAQRLRSRYKTSNDL